MEGLCTICIVKEQIKCTVLLLQKGVHELKETQKGIELMCHEMEKIYSAGMESGEKRGELKTQKETCLLYTSSRRMPGNRRIFHEKLSVRN